MKTTKHLMGSEAPHARRVKAARIAWGYSTVQAFADALRLERSRIANVEGGHPLSLDLARKIKLRTGLPLEWLLDGEWSFLLPHLRERLQAAGFEPEFDTQRPSPPEPAAKRKRKTSAG